MGSGPLGPSDRSRFAAANREYTRSVGQLAEIALRAAGAAPGAAYDTLAALKSSALESFAGAHGLPVHRRRKLVRRYVFAPAS